MRDEVGNISNAAYPGFVSSAGCRQPLANPRFDWVEFLSDADAAPQILKARV